MGNLFYILVLTFVFMLHKGEIIETHVRQSGISITKLASRLGKSRRHIYNIFDSSNVPIETILHIGKIINHDFVFDFPDFTKLAAANNNPAGLTEQVSDVESDKNYFSNNAEYWKTKYLTLLEEHNRLLREHYDGL